MNIFIHRRDLRIQDNVGLYNLDTDVIPIFIFDPLQIDSKKNKFFSNNLVNFMCESLIELNNEYKNKKSSLQFFYGNYITVIENIIKNNDINSISFNLDYSPYSKKRDNDIIDLCKKNNVNCNSNEDMLLIPIKSKQSLIPSSQKPYTVFTPFMKNLKKYKVIKPIKKIPNFNNELINSDYNFDVNDLKKLYIKNQNLHVKGGRKNGKKILNNIKQQKKYNEMRNFLNYTTTNLSAYINLGILSIREVYYKILNELGEENGLITELYWRDFYYIFL